MKRLPCVLLTFAAATTVTCSLVFAQQPTPVPAPATAPPPFYPQSGGGYFAPGSSWLQQGGQSDSHRLAQKYLKAENKAEKNKLEQDLLESLSKQFDQHMDQQKKELADLEKQIEDLKATLKKRQDAKDSIVKRRAEQLIHEAEGLGWNTPGGPPRGGFGGGFSGRSMAPPADVVPVRPGNKLER